MAAVSGAALLGARPGVYLTVHKAAVASGDGDAERGRERLCPKPDERCLDPRTSALLTALGTPLRHTPQRQTLRRLRWHSLLD